MWNVLKKIKGIGKKSMLYKTAFRSKGCSCVFKIKKFYDQHTVGLQMIKICDEHKSLENDKEITLRIHLLEEGIDKGDFQLDTVGYMKMNREETK